jgi:hypothetical protein
MAQRAFEERDRKTGQLDRVVLAVLADAVEDAGCGNAALVDHLRSEGPHEVACWVIDRLRSGGGR